METLRNIRVVIVDDHELLRGGIRFALLAAPDVVVVGEAHSGDAAVRVCLDIQPDVVLMDMRLAGDMDGVAATQAILTSCPKIQVTVQKSPLMRATTALWPALGVSHNHVPGTCLRVP